MFETVGLTLDMILVLGVLLFTALLLIFNLARVDIVALGVLVILGLTRLLPPEELFSGFSSEAVVAIIAIMIISGGLEKVGVSLNVARWMLKTGREHPYRISIIMMLIAGFMASFMRSLGTVAICLPIVNRITARTGLAKNFLLLPMAFCAILGGTITMVGTGPLIILNSLLGNAYEYTHSQGIFLHRLVPFKLFEVTPIGLCLLGLGILYLLIIFPRFFKPKKTAKDSGGSTRNYFKKTYGKGGEIFELIVLPESPLLGKNVRDLEEMVDATTSVLALINGQDSFFPPLRKTIIEAKAKIAFMGKQEVINRFAKEHKLKLLPKLDAFAEMLHPIRAGLCEAVIPPSSELIGKEVRDLNMKRRHKIHTLALYRGNQVYLTYPELNQLTLRSGDTLGMYADWNALSEFKKDPNFVLITTAYPREKIYPKKKPWAVFFFLSPLILVALGFASISIGLLYGAIGMVLSGVLSIDEAYRKISWNTVFLLAGLIPLGLVMQKTGTTDLLTSLMTPKDTYIPQWVIQSGLAVATTLLSLVITNIGATVLMVPVAIDIAVSIGADPRMFALIIALSASNTFLLPTHQANALIAGPGGYQPKDFVRIGGGMTVLYWIVVLVMLNLLY